MVHPAAHTTLCGKAGRAAHGANEGNLRVVNVQLATYFCG